MIFTTLTMEVWKQHVQQAKQTGSGSLQRSVRRFGKVEM